MAKKKTTRSTRTQPVRHASGDPHQINRRLLHALVLGSVVGVATVPGYVLFGGSAPVVVPAIAGVAIGLLAEAWLDALAGSGVYAVFAAIVYPPLFSMASFTAAATTPDKNYFGDIIFRSIFQDLLAPLVQAADPVRLGAGGVLVAGAGLAGVFAALTFLLKAQIDLAGLVPAQARRWISTDRDKLLSAIVLAIVVAALAFSAYSSTGAVRRKAAVKLQDGNYSTDYYIYLRTYQLVSTGTNYYRALYRATVGDSRLIGDYKAGKPLGFYHKPSWVRFPFVFYLWRAVGGGGPDGVVASALLLAALGVFFVGLGAERWLPAGAGVPIALFAFPYAWILTGWENVFMPDVWGGLFLLLSFGLLASGRTYPAIASAVLASLCRILLWPWMAVLILGLALRAALAPAGSRRPYVIPTAVAAGAFAGVFIAFELHWRAIVTKYSFLVPPGAGSAGGFDINLAWTGLGEALKRINWVSNFVIFPYSHHLFYGTVLLVAAVALFVRLGFFDARTRDERHVYLTGLAYLAVWIAVLTIQQHSSQYWADEVMILAVAGAGLLLALPLGLRYFRGPEPAPKAGRKGGVKGAPGRGSRKTG